MNKGANEGAGQVNACMGRVGGVDERTHPGMDATDAGRRGDRIPGVQEASAPRETFFWRVATAISVYT